MQNKNRVLILIYSKLKYEFLFHFVIIWTNYKNIQTTKKIEPFNYYSLKLYNFKLVKLSNLINTEIHTNVIFLDFNQTYFN